MFDSGTESGEDYRRQSQESLQQFMDGIKTSLEKAGGQDENLIGQVQTALTKLKTTLQGGGRHSVQEIELVGLITRLQVTLNSVVREEAPATPTRVLVEKTGVKGRFGHFPELKPVSSQQVRSDMRSISTDETLNTARTSDSDKENKLSSADVPPDIEKGKSVPWKVRLAKRKTERAHTVNISPCNTLDLRQSIRAAARNKNKEDIERATGGQLAPCFDFQLGRVGLLEAQASREQEKTQPCYFVKQKSIGDLYTPRPRPYGAQKKAESPSDDSDDGIVFYGLQKSSKSYGDIQNYLGRSSVANRNFVTNGEAKPPQKISLESDGKHPKVLQHSSSKTSFSNDKKDLSRDGSIEIIEAEGESEEVVEVATLVFNMRDNDVRLEKRPERPGTLSLTSNNNHTTEPSKHRTTGSTSTDTDDEKNAVTAQLTIRGPLRRQEAMENTLADPSKILFTENEAIQIAVHKAAINKQLSREYRRQPSKPSPSTPEEEQVLTGSFQLHSGVKPCEKTERPFALEKQVSFETPASTKKLENGRQDGFRSQGSGSFKSISRDSSLDSILEKPTSNFSVTKITPKENLEKQKTSANFPEKLLNRDSSRDSMSQRQLSNSSTVEDLSQSQILQKQGSVSTTCPRSSLSRGSSTDSSLQKLNSSSSIAREFSGENILQNECFSSAISRNLSHDNILQKQLSNASVSKSYPEESIKTRTTSFEIPTESMASVEQPEPVINIQVPGTPDKSESMNVTISNDTEAPPSIYVSKAVPSLHVFDTGIQKSRSSGSIVHKPRSLVESEDSDRYEESRPVSCHRSDTDTKLPAGNSNREEPPVEEPRTSAAEFLQKQQPWNQVPRTSANDGELSENKPALKITAKERTSRHESKYKRRDSVKQQARRANTINIPKAYAPESVSPQRTEAPAFIPKTENDRKFLAFICQNTTTPTVTPPTFTRAGGGHGVGGIWGSRFSNLKTAFESKASSSTAVSPEPPKNRPRPEPKIDSLFVAQKVYDTSHQLGRCRQTSAPTTPVVQQRAEGFARQNSGNADVKNRYSVYSVNRVSANASHAPVTVSESEKNSDATDTDLKVVTTFIGPTNTPKQIANPISNDYGIESGPFLRSPKPVEECPSLKPQSAIPKTEVGVPQDSEEDFNSLEKEYEAASTLARQSDSRFVKEEQFSSLSGSVEPVCQTEVRANEIVTVSESAIIVPEINKLSVKIPEKSKQTFEVSDGKELVAKAFVNIGACEQVPKPSPGETKNIRSPEPKQEMPGESRNSGKSLITEQRKDTKPPLFMTSPTVAITPPWVKDIGRVDGVMPVRRSALLSPPAQKKFFEQPVPQSSRQNGITPSDKNNPTSNQLSDKVTTRNLRIAGEGHATDRVSKRDKEDVLALVKDLEANSMLIQGLIMSEEQVREAVARDHVENSDRLAKQTKSNQTSRFSSSVTGLSKSSSDSSMKHILDNSVCTIIQPSPKPYRKAFVEEQKTVGPPELPRRQINSPRQELPKLPARTSAPSPSRPPVIEQQRHPEQQRFNQEKSPQQGMTVRQSPQRARRQRPQSVRVTSGDGNGVTRTKYTIDREDQFDASSEDSSDDDSSSGVPKRYGQAPIHSPTGLKSLSNIVHKYVDDQESVIRTSSAGSLPLVKTGSQSSFQSDVGSLQYLPPRVSSSPVGPPIPQRVPSTSDNRNYFMAQAAPPLPPKASSGTHSSQKSEAYYNQQYAHAFQQPAQVPNFDSRKEVNNPQEQPVARQPQPLPQTHFNRQNSLVGVRSQSSGPVSSLHNQIHPKPDTKNLSPLNIPSQNLPIDVSSPPVLSFAYASSQAPRVDVPEEFLETETLTGLRSHSSHTVKRVDIKRTEQVHISAYIAQKPIPPPRKVTEEPKPLPRTVFDQPPKQTQNLQLPRSNSGSRVAALTSAIDGGLFKQQDNPSNRSPSPRRPQSLYAGDGTVVAAGKTSPRNSLSIGALRSLPKQFEACISPNSAERKQEELIKFFFDTPNLLAKTQQVPNPPKASSVRTVGTTVAKQASATQRSTSSTNLVGSPSQRRILTQTSNKVQLRHRTHSDGTMPSVEHGDVSDIASDIDSVFDDLMKKGVNGQAQGRAVSGFQKSVTASQSANATMMQKSQGVVKKSTVSSSSFRTQSQTSTVTVNPGGSAFSKFQQLDRVNSAASPSTPKSATSGPAFNFGAPATKTGIVTVKDAILQWCQGRTRGYKNVQITDFSNSWTDGLAFCALIHHFYPDSFDFDSLDPKNRRYNLELAFRTADEKAGIAPLLDVEDMICMRKPDWKCVFTYIQTFYRRLKDQ